MPTPPWATDEQLKFLEGVLPGFHSAQWSKSTSTYKTDVFRQFFERWPNQAAENEDPVLSTVLEKKEFKAAAKKAKVVKVKDTVPMDHAAWTTRRKEVRFF